MRKNTRPRLMEGEEEEEKEILEGKARIKCGKGTGIFYNPVQMFNRDLTVLVLREYASMRSTNKAEAPTRNGEVSNEAVDGKPTDQPPAKRSRHSAGVQIRGVEQTGGLRILDALSASGLRALRFAKEVPEVELVVANDFSLDAVEAIKENVKVNAVEHIVKPSYSDAIDVMMQHRSYAKRFHAVDLDPYGSASLFLDPGIQAVTDGGILMVTCTDMATLCGNTPEACLNKYGSIPLRHKACHEIALRILVRAIAAHAARHGRFIKPLLSVSVDFYVRVFVQLSTGALEAKESAAMELQPLIRKSTKEKGPSFQNATHQTELVLSGMDENGGATCVRCVHCAQGAIHLAGPIYTAPIHDASFVANLLARLKAMPAEERFGTHERLLGMLTVISEELHDIPLFYDQDQLMHVVRCPVPKLLNVRSAIFNAGYRCSIAHCNPRALKTDAPVAFLWDICRTWARKNSIDTTKLKNNPAGVAILSAQISREVNFTINRMAMQKSTSQRLLRFQDNKGKNWGPKAKAKPINQPPNNNRAEISEKEAGGEG